MSHEAKIKFSVGIQHNKKNLLWKGGEETEVGD
jgi:hypothetical protein